MKKLKCVLCVCGEKKTPQRRRWLSRYTIKCLSRKILRWQGTEIGGILAVTELLHGIMHTRTLKWDFHLTHALPIHPCPVAFSTHASKQHPSWEARHGLDFCRAHSSAFSPPLQGLFSASSHFIMLSFCFFVFFSFVFFGFKRRFSTYPSFCAAEPSCLAERSADQG